ncbi:MAG TPA: phosphoethanolamine--lipid A transferase [Steroidobacteraceae bacterium]|nr:phosphoethanolamine--lipid A transferase [Steroidobacteraceae bacterium]
MVDETLAAPRDPDVRGRPTLRVETLVLVVVAFMVATANGPWWQAVTAGRSFAHPGTWTFITACFVALVALHFVVLAAVAHRWVVKPLLTVIVIAAAGAAYYMRTFTVILDPSMIQNVLRTDAREAGELLSWGMLASVLARSAIAVAFIWWVNLAQPPLMKALAMRAGTVLGALVVAVLAVLAMSRDITSFMRNQHEARYLITPGNFLYGFAMTAMRGMRNASVPREVVGQDARVVRVALATRPRVLVLIVGETARAENFSLLGYSRPTNPELAQLDVTAFSQVTSCGTSTEVSVPCMFSQVGRADYDERRIRNSEGLLDVLARAGYTVKWIDNQSGCKGVCSGARVEVSKIDASTTSGLCDGTECYDGVLVERLHRELETIRGDTVLVLHMMGNHGPAYFKRYPPQFRRFTPDCATAQLRDCTREQVINAYDNAILYTDHVLAQIVTTLAAAGGRMDSAMLYVSDHGESLGEKGLYLHGIPYAIAPSQQTHIPMVLWLSPGLTANGDVNASCVHERANESYSHDNLFHSVLGLLNVRTRAYRPDRDVFAGCRGRAYLVQGAERRKI